MDGLDPSIHVNTNFAASRGGRSLMKRRRVDGRRKAGHDELVAHPDTDSQRRKSHL
jgi:hypothetical protein